MTAAWIWDSLGALYRFNKENILDKKDLLYIGLAALIWGYIWIQLLLSIDEEIMKKIVWILLLLLLPVLFIQPATHTDLQKSKPTLWQKILWYICLTLTAAYSTFFWPNGWFFSLYTLVWFFKYDIIKAHATGKFTYLIMSTLWCIIFFSQGIVQRQTILILFLGMFIWSYLWAHSMLKLNLKRIKILIASMIIISAVYILFF